MAFQLTNRVQRDEEGAYRWIYEMDMMRNKSILMVFFKYLVPIFLVISAAGALMGMFPLWFGLLILTGLMALLTGGYFIVAMMRRGRKRTPFYMDDIQISMSADRPRKIPVHPGSPRYGLCRFEAVRSIRTFPEYDMIELTAGTPYQMYVPREDYDMVLDHVLSHVSENVREKYRRRT